MTDDEDNNLTVVDFGEIQDPSEREAEIVMEALSDPWRRSTIELGLATGHIVNEHGASLSIILIAKHLGLMIKSYSDPSLYEESIATVMAELRVEVMGDESD